MSRRSNPRSHDYQGQHAPPGPDDVADGTAAPFHDIERVMPDYYAHPEWYRTGSAYEWEAVNLLLAARNHPSKQVRVYRAVPKNVKTINPGDWVTQSRRYAEEHLESNLGGQGKILSVWVKAGSLFTAGDSHFEWGWWPDVGRPRRNPHHVFHGGRLEGPLEVRPHKRGEGEHGAGVYATTKLGTARMYGSPIYQFTLADDVVWLDEIDIPVEAVEALVGGLRGLRNRQAIARDLAGFLERRPGPTIPAEVVRNVFLNNGALSGQIGPVFTAWLVRHGAQAEHVHTASDEDWVVIFDPAIVLKVERLDPKQAGKTYPFDQPLIRGVRRR